MRIGMFFSLVSLLLIRPLSLQPYDGSPCMKQEGKPATQESIMKFLRNIGIGIGMLAVALMAVAASRTGA